MTDRKKLLCIEDDVEMIDLMRLILERKGYDFVGAEGGQQGWELICQERPDLILLDLMMPGMNGWEVYRQLKADAELEDTPVIIVTAKAQSIDKLLGLKIAGVDDYITKPFSPSELLARIQRALDAREV